MILNSTPQNEAIMSNVGEIGEFRIRNSAKAFNILSSGLYANKIKAIIRELSCNAVDSHTVAGNTNPFDVHIPTFLEPYFAIRDYGTGLDHEQVTSIYTTYFESTKTGSNDFIGALGLGSKSPFSYTDNFTVTAIKNGRKGIYTAFINEAGVPSIALMGEEQTDEPAGVEVRFAVESRFDMQKFESEAESVFRWFKQRPNFTGKTVNITEVKYDTKDIIPGVHLRTDGHSSVAVMGNIAYPIEIPSAKQIEVARLLNCGLVMEFEIGELDFQASREGLSYIPQTVDAIVKKLEALNLRLADFVAEGADKIENEWERSYYLSVKRNQSLFTSATDEYVKKTNFALYDINSRYNTFNFKFKVADLASAYNIQLRGFQTVSYRDNGFSNLKSSSTDFGEKDDKGHRVYAEAWKIPVASNVVFVENDTKTGATERAKHHWRTESKRSDNLVYVIEPVDRSKPMKLDAFYKAIHNPNDSQRVKASTLRQKDRVASGGMGKNVTIVHLEERGDCSSCYHKSKDLVWRAAGKVSDFDANETYYYIPLSGFAPQWNKFKYDSCHSVVTQLRSSGIKELNVPVYGVRKGDIEQIKKLKNWVNLEDHIQQVFDKLGDKSFMGCVLEKLKHVEIFKYNVDKMVENIHVGPAYDVLKDFVGVPKSGSYNAMRELTAIFSKNFSIDALVHKYTADVQKLRARYPLIEKLGYDAKTEDVIHYINLVDSVK